MDRPVVFLACLEPPQLGSRTTAKDATYYLKVLVFPNFPYFPMWVSGVGKALFIIPAC